MSKLTKYLFNQCLQYTAEVSTLKIMLLLCRCVIQFRHFLISSTLFWKYADIRKSCVSFHYCGNCQGDCISFFMNLFDLSIYYNFLFGKNFLVKFCSASLFRFTYCNQLSTMSTLMILILMSLLSTKCFDRSYFNFPLWWTFYLRWNYPRCNQSFKLIFRPHRGLDGTSKSLRGFLPMAL